MTARAAISFVGATSQGSAGNSNSITVVRPVAAANNDLLVATIVQDQNGTISAPAGWVRRRVSNGTRLPRVVVFTKAAGASEPANYTFTSTVSQEIVGGIAAFRGVNTANPVNASGIRANAPSTSATAPSVTTTVADTVLVSSWGVNNTTLTAPGAMTQAVNATGGPGGSQVRVGIAYQNIAATGATGTRVATLGDSRSSNGASLALRPRLVTLSGTVFEDSNYGGGAGRSLAASGGVGVSGATVELYNSSGVFQASATTAANGGYTFSVSALSTYYVRVVNSSVRSNRSGWVASLRGVQTFRTTAAGGSAVAVTDHVGGINPAVVDPGTAPGGATFNTTTFVYSAGLSGTAQSVTAVAAGISNIAGLDFGFNFDTVVNVNDAAQGSLRQALTNANTLGGDAALAQAGRTAGLEHLVFMIGNGSAAAGLRSSIDLTSGGVATITPSSALPALSSTLVVDARTQPGWGSTPVVALDGSATAAGIAGLVVAADNCTIGGLAINRFGGNGITLGSGTSGHVVVANHIGTDAAGTVAAANGGHGIDVRAGGVTIGGTGVGNLVSGNTGSGIYVNAAGTTIAGNRIGSDVGGGGAIANAHGIRSASSTGLTIGGAAPGAANTIRGNSGHGLWFEGGNTAVNARGNTIAANAGHGVTLSGAVVSQVDIQANSIHANGSLGIDLGNDGVNANTGSKDASKPNAAMNHPVFTGAGVAGGGASVTVFGYVGTGSGQAVFAGARVELFKSAIDASGYGEGQVYLGALTADANGRFSGTIAVAPGTLAVGDAVTATATDSGGNTSEFGPNWTTTTVEALTPAGFEAFDSGTAALSISGPLTTRVAAVATTADIIALNAAGNALHAGFTGTVTLTWIDARDDSGAATGSCRASWVDVAAAGSASFANASRVTVALTPPTAGTRVMRLKMAYSGLAGTVTACSGDAFAIIPATYTIAATDGDSATAGTSRALNNLAAAGGVVHRAGRPFTVIAQARDALGNPMSAYDGTPALATVSCLLPAGCTAGALIAAATAAVAGVYTHPNVSYAEVGVVSLQLTDTSYADIDAADTAAAARQVQSAELAVGRFVPDALTATVSGAGQFATANGACLAAGSGATFVGQGFGWAASPQVTVTARNAAGTVTSLWTGALMKLAGGGAVPSLAVSGAGGATLSSSFGAIAVADLGGGQARLSASLTDLFMLELPPGTAQPSVTPDWTWTLAVTDASEAAVVGNPTLATSAAQTPIGFDAGAVFHSARLALAPAHGDARVGVRALAQLQRYTSAGWVTMTEDRGCVTIARQHLGVESPSGVFGTAGVCAAPIAADATTTAGGRAWLALPGTPGAAPGRLRLRLAGAAAAGFSCTAAGATQPLVPMAMPYLLGGAAGAGPTAGATWGAPNRDAVLRREIW